MAIPNQNGIDNSFYNVYTYYLILRIVINIYTCCLEIQFNIVLMYTNIKYIKLISNFRTIVYYL